MFSRSSAAHQKVCPPCNPAPQDQHRHLREACADATAGCTAVCRSELGAAKSLLQKARELCPPDRQQAIQRIDKFAAAVQKAM